MMWKMMKMETMIKMKTMIKMMMSANPIIHSIPEQLIYGNIYSRL
jgi:hypothetical protein